MYMYETDTTSQSHGFEMQMKRVLRTEACRFTLPTLAAGW
tara:strand:+ start:117 stop:236 length:120 start_codon:yes stop_codon:yes gene_type:complete